MATTHGNQNDPVPASPGNATSPRVLLPRAPWLAATLVALILALAGAAVVGSTVDRASQRRFDVTIDVFESIIKDHTSGYQIIGFVIPAVMAPDGVGMTIDSLDGFLGDTGVGATVVGALPIDGFVGLGFLSFGPEGTIDPVMLPNGSGITEESLMTAAVLELAAQVLEQRKPILSEPIDLPGETRYVYVVPATDEVVILEFIDPSDLLAGAGNRQDAQLVTAIAYDTATGARVGSTGPAPTGAQPNQTLVANVLGRTVAIDLYPGPDLGWETGVIPAAVTGVLGLVVSGLVFVVGVASRRRTFEQKERLRIARKNLEDKDQFIAAVSHELRTPLTAVVGLADELTAAWDEFDPDEVRQLTEIIAQEGSEMALLVEDLLVAARIEGGEVRVEPQMFSVAEQIHWVTRALGSKGTNIEIGDLEVKACGDPLRVRQIVRNLVTNALRHGGDQIRVSASENGSMVSVQVSDSGYPVAEDARKKMFEPYYRSAVHKGHQPSVGLGLSVSYHLAELMGGELTYRHEDGWGTFQLDLPKAP